MGLFNERSHSYVTDGPYEIQCGQYSGISEEKIDYPDIPGASAG